VLDRNSAFGDLQRKSELQDNKSEFEGGCFVLSRSRVVALPCISFLVPSSSLFAEHSVITIATSFVLADRVQITFTNRVDSFRRYRPTHFLHRVPFRGVSAAPIPLNNYLRVCNIEGRWLSFFFSRVSWQDKAMDDETVASGA
jgi:hypothetical protein